MSWVRWTTEELRDAWARWDEARPEECDWKIHMDVVSEEFAFPELAELAPLAYKAASHVMVVKLLGAPDPWRRALYPGVEPDGWTEREQLAEWRLATLEAVRVIDVLTEAWAEPDLIGAVLSGHGRTILEHWVWERLK